MGLVLEVKPARESHFKAARVIPVQSRCICEMREYGNEGKEVPMSRDVGMSTVDPSLLRIQTEEIVERSVIERVMPTARPVFCSMFVFAGDRTKRLGKIRQRPGMWRRWRLPDEGF